jgi:carbon starvation protein
MNVLWIAIPCLVWFYLGYRYYGGHIERHLVQPDDDQTPPSARYKDGVDFFPSRKRLLWGNHFASIAGAGPIIGPILAVSIFGWGPTLLWIALGTIFFGAVHDYLCLMVSTRHGGKGIAELAKSALGGLSGVSVALLIYCMLVLVIAVFMVSVAQSLITVPALVIPTFGLTLVAMLMGLAIYRWNVNETVASIVAVLLAYTLIWVGYYYPLSLPANWAMETVLAVWFVILGLYCLLASIAPIWLILQSRDFISSIKLIVGLAIGFLGLFVIHPAIEAPAWSGLPGAPDKPLWPAMFIIVACGAISGFHALVSTGTSARQLKRESDGKAIGFGGMVMEGVLSLMVVLVVVGGLSWGYAPAGLEEGRAGLHFGNALSENWIVAFGRGFGSIVGALDLPWLTVPLASLLGASMVKSFIMTTLDSGTRLARFLVTESLGNRIPLLKNNTLATLAALVPAFFLAVTNSYKTIWQMFGKSNQLIAAVALVTLTLFLVRAGKKGLYTMIPAVFMIATALAALLWDVFNPRNGFLSSDKPNLSLGLISLALLFLALLVIIRAARIIWGREDSAADAAPQPVVERS